MSKHDYPQLPEQPTINLGFFYDGGMSQQERFFQIVTMLVAQSAKMTEWGYFFKPDDLLAGLEQFSPKDYAKLILSKESWLYAIVVENLVNVTTSLSVVSATPYDDYLQPSQQLITFELSGRPFVEFHEAQSTYGKLKYQLGMEVYQRFYDLITFTSPTYASISVEFGKTISIEQLRTESIDLYMFNNFYLSNKCVDQLTRNSLLTTYQKDSHIYVDIIHDGLYFSKNAIFNSDKSEATDIDYENLRNLLISGYLLP